MASEELLSFHHEFTKYFIFLIPINQKNLAMVLHPNWGYFCKFRNYEFTFEQIIDFYRNEVFSSFIRNSGRDILSNRLTAFNYWKIADPELKGFLTFQEFLSLLEAMAFNTDDKSIEGFKNEHSIALNNLPNELLNSPNGNNIQKSSGNIFRFRLFEYLFMQRCAIY
jgi:hypothetical protein